MIKDILAKTAYVLLKTGQYICIYHCVTNYMVTYVVCAGESMEPTVRPGDIWAVEGISRFRRTIQKGDIVAVQSPFNPDQILCKRIVAMAGDKVKTNSETVFIPRGHIWIEGDNKGVSVDSRQYGPVPYALIKNRLMFRIWSKYR